MAAITYQRSDGRIVREAEIKEKSAAVRAVLKQAFPGVTFSVRTTGHGTSRGYTSVRWDANHYDVDRDAVWSLLHARFDRDAEPTLVDGEWVSYPGGIWSGPDRR